MIKELIQQEAEKRYGYYINYPLVFKEGAEFALKNQWVKASEMEDRKEYHTYYAKYGDKKGVGIFIIQFFYWDDGISTSYLDKLFILDENI